MRRLFLPVALLAAALYLRSAAPRGEPAAILLLSTALLFLAWRLRRGLAEAFFAPDDHGRCLAGCSARTGRRARGILAVLVLGSAISAVLVLVFRSASLEHAARLAAFAWGCVGVAVALWLVVRRDVLHALIPAGDGAGLTQTVGFVLRLVWPVAALFFAVVLVLSALGYQRAASFLLTHVLALAGALAVIGTAHALLRALLQRRFGATTAEDEDEDDLAAARRQLVRSSLGALLTVGTLGLLLLSVSLVLGLGPDQWRAVGDISLTGQEAGQGLTIGRLVQAALILVVSFGLARYARSLTRVVLRSRGGLKQGTRYAVRTVLFYSIAILGVLSALATLGLDMTQFGWFLTAAGVGIGFGLQEIISNFISGLILFIERPVQVGDVISVGDIEGDVQQINIRSTVVRTRDGMSIILPNKALITDNVVNWSHGDQRTRLRIQVSVAYGSDVALVKRILLDIASADPRILARPAPEVEFLAFGESELNFVLFLWLRTPDITLRRRVRSDVNSAIDRAFAAHGVTIPFPQRDVHIKAPADPTPPAPEPPQPLDG